MSNLSRYREGTARHGGLGTARAVQRIRDAVKAGRIGVTTKVLKSGQRLDQVAFDSYGDSRLWWVIAAASNIGWWMQAPPGTQLLIPTTLSEVEREI